MGGVSISNSMFTIEKNVPIPDAALRRGRHSLYPFADMQVGDSFVVPYPREARSSEDRITLARMTKNRLTNAISIFRKREGNAEKGFTTRAEDGGVRVWRIA